MIQQIHANESQTATTHLLIIFCYFALIYTVFFFFLNINGCVGSGNMKHTVSLKVQWFSNYSLGKKKKQKKKSVRNTKIAKVLAPSASGLHVKLCVNVAKESPPFFIQTENTFPSRRAPVASTFNTNRSLFVMIVRYLECTFM